MISAVATSGITQTGATITWTTNESATTQVDYGLTTAYGSQTTLNSSFVASHSAALSGLSAGTTYHYRVRSRDAAGNESASLDFTLQTTTPVVTDTTAPAEITSLAIGTPSQTSLVLTWTAPGDDGATGQAASYAARYSSAAPGGSATAWWNAAIALTSVSSPKTSGSAEAYTAVGLSPGTTYYFSVRAADEAGNMSSVSAASIKSGTTAAQAVTPPSGGGGGGGGGSTADTTPPPPVTGVVVSAANGQVALAWENPVSTDYVRTRIVRKEGSAPTSPTDGTVVYEGTSEVFVDTNLTNGKEYRYAIYTLDRVPNYSTALQYGVTPLSGNSGFTLAIAKTSSGQKVYVLVTKTLSTGTSGEEVLSLQYVLIAKKYLNRTDPENSFDAATREALRKFQCAEKISCAGDEASTGYGLAGPKTRARVNQLLKDLGATGTPLALIGTFTRSLKVGDRGADVKMLQQFLNARGFTISLAGPGAKGQETEYFGPATAAAITKLQEAYAKEILVPAGLTRGTGYFGPGTIRQVLKLRGE